MTPQKAFEQYHRAVYSFSYRFTRREELAEDITQECFLALIRAPQRFDPARGSMKTFLLAIARNLALKHYRDQRAEEPLEEGSDETPDPRGGLEISAAVAAAVSDLPLLQKEALILFEYEGATLEEIAAITGAEIGTVKARLHRARQNLRRVLAPHRKAEKPHGTL